VAPETRVMQISQLVANLSDSLGTGTWPTWLRLNQFLTS